MTCARLLRFMITSGMLVALPGVGAAQTAIEPRSDDQVIERLGPAHRDAGLRAALTARGIAALEPDERLHRVRELLRDAHRFADARLFDRVRTLLADDRLADDARALRMRASVHAWFHEFDDARRDLWQVLRKTPEAAEVWFALAGVERVSGRLEQAAQACERAYREWTDPRFALCAADVASLRGDDRGARRWLAGATGRHSFGDDGAGWWLLTRAMIDERIGETASATRGYRASLLAADAMVLTNFAHWALERNDDALLIRTVRHLMPDQERTLGDDLLVSLAIALRRTGDQDTATQLTQIAQQRFRTAERVGWPVHWRARARLALYLEDDPVRALDYAQRNWATQREPIDARLLARAAKAAERPRALEPLREFVDRTGFTDPTLAALLDTGAKR